METKPQVELTEEDGNIFNLLAVASRELKKAGKREKAAQLKDRILGGEPEDYHHAIRIIMEYIEAT